LSAAGGRLSRRSVHLDRLFVDAAEAARACDRSPLPAVLPETWPSTFVPVPPAGRRVEVVAMGTQGDHHPAAEVGTLEPEQVVRDGHGGRPPGTPEAVLVPGHRDAHAGKSSESWKAAIGKAGTPLRIRLTVWKGLQLLGPVPAGCRGFGALFFGDRRLTNFIEPLYAAVDGRAIIADKLRLAIGHGGGSNPGGAAQRGRKPGSQARGSAAGPRCAGRQCSGLTQEGLLVSIRNRGLFVIEMTPERRPADMYLAAGGDLEPRRRP